MCFNAILFEEVKYILRLRQNNKKIIGNFSIQCLFVIFFSIEICFVRL